MGYFSEKDLEQQEAVIASLKRRLDTLNYGMARYTRYGSEPPQRLVERYNRLLKQYRNLI